MKLTNIASLDPIITASGRVGLRSASAADREMWQEMKFSSASFAVECQNALIEAEKQASSEDVTPENRAIDRLGEDRVVQTTTRIGQSFFRETVLSAYNGRCCITGLSVPTLLVASHIVPWSRDELNRLNPRNGLALSALHDRAFDAGLITIDDDFTIRVSKNLAVQDDDFLEASIKLYQGRPIRLPEKFGIGEEFLAYHREHIFQK